MSQNQHSSRNVTTDGNSTHDKLLNRNRITGLATIIIGLSLLLVTLATANRTLSIIVMGASGWLLVGIGSNVLRGRRAFETGLEVVGERMEWVITAVIFAVAVGVAAAAIVLL